MATDNIKIPNIIGLPPGTYFSDDLMKNSMPTLEILPSIPNLEEGITLFNLSPAMDKWKQVLEAHKYEYEGDIIKVAFIADNFPADTFSNEYGETFLQKMTDVVSEGTAQLTQMTGETNVVDAMKKMGEFTSGFGNVGKGVGSMMTGGANKLNEFVKGLTSSGSGAKQAAGQMASMASSMLGGSRVDFPQLWKGSSFSPSYSFTVRLYNPNPASDIATKKYIIGPLAALLTLGLPRSQDGSTYNWPYLHQINCPGLWILSPCFINNITVIKGGDQQQIGWNQRLGVVDVRFEIGSLYNTMIMPKEGTNYKNRKRPTLENYLNALSGEKKLEIIHDDPEGISDGSVPIINQPGVKNQVQAQQNSNVKDFDSTPSSRLDSTKKSTLANLIEQSPLYGLED